MILHLTQHPATPDQLAAGVVDLGGDDRAALVRLLTFEALPTRAEIIARADALAALAAAFAASEDREDGTTGFALSAMIGGAPYLMAPLETALRDAGIEPVYAFSVRESEEKTQPDGTIRKVAVFRHAGFVGRES